MTKRFPEIPLEAWRPTKGSLHLYCQIVGKIREAKVLEFLDSAYQAGSKLAGWDASELDAV